MYEHKLSLRLGKNANEARYDTQNGHVYYPSAGAAEAHQVVSHEFGVVVIEVQNRLDTT